MKVAIDLGLKKSQSYPLLYNYVVHSMQQLAALHPEHSFIIFNRRGKLATLQGNFSVSPAMPTRKTWMTFFKKSVKYSPDILVEFFHPLMSVTKNAVLIIPDPCKLALHSSIKKKDTLRFQKQLGKAIGNAREVIISSVYYRDLLNSTYQLPPGKVRLLNYNHELAAKTFTWEEKEKIREEVSNGKEYFLFAGDLHPRYELVALLKAFSQFKKRMSSNMQLIIAGYEGEASPLTTELYHSYKYKTDVKILSNPSAQQVNQLMAAAYCYINPARSEPFPIQLILAMRMQVPVITTDLPEIREFTGDALIYTEPEEFKLSAAMQRIYKDECWRNECISKATVQLEKLESHEAFKKKGMILQQLTGS